MSWTNLRNEWDQEPSSRLDSICGRQPKEVTRPNFQFRVEASRCSPKKYSDASETSTTSSSFNLIKKRSPITPYVCTFRSSTRTLQSSESSTKIDPISLRNKDWHPGPSQYIAKPTQKISIDDTLCCIDSNYIVGGFNERSSTLDSSSIEKVPLRATTSLPITHKEPPKKLLQRSATDPAFTRKYAFKKGKKRSESQVDMVDNKVPCYSCQKALSRASKRRRVKYRWKRAMDSFRSKLFELNVRLFLTLLLV